METGDRVSRSRRPATATFLVCGVLFIPPLPATAAGQDPVLPETMTEDIVAAFLTEHDISTAEAFIAALPPLHKTHYMAIYRSDSPVAEFISTEHPRIVSWGADSRFVVTWTTHPDDPNGNQVEFLQPLPEEGRWSAGVIDFSGTTAEIRHPNACSQCHGTLNRPLWGAYQ